MAMKTIPQLGVALGTFEKLDKMQMVQQTRISVQQRKEALFQQPALSGLDGWSTKNWAATHVLLAEYHNILSLEPEELSCIDLEKYEIKVTDDEPFKERF